MEKFVARRIGGEGGVLLFLKGINQGAGVFLFTDCRDLDVVCGLGRSGGQVGRRVAVFGL